jgi:hypothetical protein
MSTPDPVPSAAAAPWYTSKVQIAQITALISAAAAMFPKIAAKFGLAQPADVQVAVETTFGFIAIAAPVLGTIWRAKSTIQPLTLTRAAAAVHPATIAAAAAQVATNGVSNAQANASPPPPAVPPAA